MCESEPLMSPTLYGDGVHDDAPAIQAMLDSGASEIFLPVPKERYAIGETLRIHGGQTLRLGATTEIRLLPMKDCCMLTNADPGDDPALHITVTGGIWNRDNMRQPPHPDAPKPAPGHEYPMSRNGPEHWDAHPEYDKAAVVDEPFDLPRERKYLNTHWNFIMAFTHARYFTLRDLTFKDPTTFAFFGAYLEYFTIENIRFDFNHGNPYAINMDGIHLDGGCRFGHIRNLQGSCYDDLIALNADDFVHGPIEDLEIDGIFSDNCHSAVRMLTTKSWIRRITISNIYGTFFQYCVGVSRYFYRPEEKDRLGLYSDIVLRNIFASKAPRYGYYCKNNGYVYSLIWIEQYLYIRRLSIENLRRMETETPIHTILVQPHTRIDSLSLRHCSQENKLNVPITFLRHEGSIGKLYLEDIETNGDVLKQGAGTIDHLYCTEDMKADLKADCIDS